MCRGMHFVFKQVKLLQFDAKQGHTASSFDAKLGKINSNFAAYLMPNKAGTNFDAIAPFHSLVKRMSQLFLTQNVQGFFLLILCHMHDINSINETEMYGIMSMISKMGTNLKWNSFYGML